MKVCAGIVLYNPDIKRLRQCIEAIIDQVELLIIANNASGNIDDIIKELSDDRIFLIKNGSNLGIAAALNQLTNHAVSNGYDWILTLDQDSICEEKLLEKLLTAAQGENIAMVTPLIIDRGIPEEGLEQKELLPATENVSFCITSGCLTNVKAVIETGGFNEWLFIYEVDREICIRLLHRGYKMIRVNTVRLYHEHGTKTINRRILWKKVTYRNYTPSGVYYQTRNLVYMLRKYGAQRSPRPFFRWIHLYLAFLIKLIYEPERSMRLKAFTKGIKDGFAARH